MVLISGKDLLGTYGGHQSYVRAHAIAAKSLGYEPHVFCPRPRAAANESDLGVVHAVAPDVLPEALRTPLLARAAVEFLKSRPGPHLIHSFAGASAAGVAATRVLARSGIEAVPVASAYATRAYESGAMRDGLRRYHDRRDQLRYRARLRWVRSVDDRLEGWGYRRSKVVLVNYRSVQRLLVGAYGPKLSVIRIPYCAPAAFEAEQPPREVATPAPAAVQRLRPAAAPLVVCVSRHDPRKGIDVLLHALARLRARDIPFRACLVGGGRCLSAHRRLARALDLGEAVAQPGPLRDIRPYLERADIFVLPSLAESSGSVSVLEALRAGKTVIASGCDGIPEDLTDGKDALLVAPGDVEALTAALTRLLADPALRAELGAGAHDTSERRFSAERFVAVLGSVYSELMGVTVAARA